MAEPKIAANIYLPEDILQKLKCTLCENYLSLPPISVANSEGAEWKCGRCHDLTTEVSIRATMFETIATNMIFPCIYPNCLDHLRWDRVKQHEETCPHQRMVCPCGVHLDVCDGADHFREEHANKVSNNRFKLENVTFSQFYWRMVFKEEVPYLVYVLCERKADIKIGVFCLQSSNDPIAHEFGVKITTASNESKIYLDSQKKISKFNQRDHCSECLERRCQVRYHKYYEANRDYYNFSVYDMMQVKINAVSVLNVLQSDDFTIDLFVTKADVPVEDQDDANTMVNRHERLRKSWECQICNEYLAGPIYLCPTGHSLCTVCQEKLVNCPYCVQPLGHAARNFTLEDMAENVQLSCQNEFQGCDFKGNVRAMAKHEVKCDWPNWGVQPKKKRKLSSTTTYDVSTSDDSSPSSPI